MESRAAEIKCSPKCNSKYAIESNLMLSDLEYTYSPVRDRVRDLREYL